MGPLTGALRHGIGSTDNSGQGSLWRGAALGASPLGECDMLPRQRRRPPARRPSTGRWAPMELPAPSREWRPASVAYVARGGQRTQATGQWAQLRKTGTWHSSANTLAILTRCANKGNTGAQSHQVWLVSHNHAHVRSLQAVRCVSFELRPVAGRHLSLPLLHVGWTVVSPCGIIGPLTLSRCFARLWQAPR